MEYKITEETVNKIIQLLADKPFKQVIELLNEIQIEPNENNFLNNDLGGQNADNN
jgi:hypothetical protein